MVDKAQHDICKSANVLCKHSWFSDHAKLTRLQQNWFLFVLRKQQQKRIEFITSECKFVRREFSDCQSTQITSGKNFQ